MSLLENMIIKSVMGVSSLLFAVLPVSSGSTSPHPIQNAIHQQAGHILQQARELNPKVLQLALKAYNKARALGMNHKEVLTIIDYSLPSSKRRMWVVDMKRQVVRFHTLVAHGSNSGAIMATHFSNQSGSHTSSIGVFLTGQSYMGSHGYSLRVNGLERGINHLAYARAIAFHGARYVSDEYVRQNGHVGRSWGCYAVNYQLVKPLINTIKDGSVVVAYYPDRHWLQQSRFLT